MLQHGSTKMRRLWRRCEQKMAGEAAVEMARIRALRGLIKHSMTLRAVRDKVAAGHRCS